jgi:hypothetical protein
MKKVLIALLLLTLITPVCDGGRVIFNLDKEKSIYLAASMLSLFIGVKNSFVLSYEEDNHPGRVVLTALSYQSFVTFFALVVDKKK